MAESGKWILWKPKSVANCSGNCSLMIHGNVGLLAAHRHSSLPISTPKCRIWKIRQTSIAVSLFVGDVICINSSSPLLVNAWKHKFSLECMTLLHDQAFGAKMPTYATILQLDRKLRAFPVPPVLQVAGFGSSEPRQGGYPDSVALTLQRHIVLAIREMSRSLSYILLVQIAYQRNFCVVSSN